MPQMREEALKEDAPASLVAIRLAVPTEVVTGERRVALTPRSVKTLVRAGLVVAVEAGAGRWARVGDDQYREAGAEIVDDAVELLAGADLVLKVRCPAARPDGSHEADLIASSAVLVGLLDPTAHMATLQRLADRGVSAFSLERIPRITRAQEMDVLSSMSTVAGYHAVLRAAVRLPRFFPLLMTSAGTVQPSRVLVIGAGVAGLQAIATAHQLGAAVEGFDVRPAVREQVESLGARFVDVALEGETEDTGGYARALGKEAEEREREVLARHVADADVIITTALVPGRRAPVLITRDMVAAMRPGSIIVDLAAEAGGNCELTVPGREIDAGGVTVDGPVDVVSMMPVDASQLYAQNISHFALGLVADGALRIDLDDEILRATCVAHAGQLLDHGDVVAIEESAA